uniref:Uncharacterized protein n=1 Tax=Nelumbo nucifera TaxID=4432 RepID=A0A822ZDH4_NELNU|nr:TPA_asm: hypothetical protein HUJ06_015798 [Nelumbo nucifera]
MDIKLKGPYFIAYHGSTNLTTDITNMFISRKVHILVSTTIRLVQYQFKCGSIRIDQSQWFLTISKEVHR